MSKYCLYKLRLKRDRSGRRGFAHWRRSPPFDQRVESGPGYACTKAIRVSWSRPGCSGEVDEGLGPCLS